MTSAVVEGFFLGIRPLSAILLQFKYLSSLVVCPLRFVDRKGAPGLGYASVWRILALRFWAGKWPSKLENAGEKTMFTQQIRMLAWSDQGGARAQ
jgi:hypothetical protein